MSERTSLPRESTFALAALPFGLGLVWLVLQLSADRIWLLEVGIVASLVVLAVLVIAPLVVAWRVKRRGGRPILPAVLSIALLTPLAVISPWAVMPSRFGIGFANLASFIPWLTRYPNLGPINYEVLLGIFAVLGASAMPAFFALYRLFGTPRLVSALVFVGLCVVPWAAVAVRLDWELLVASVSIPGWSPLLALGAIQRTLGLAAVFLGLIGLGESGRSRR
ncbi:MAG: hypothetical protein AAGE52_05105 [Myxococcota bacterium]